MSRKRSRGRHANPWRWWLIGLSAVGAYVLVFYFVLVSPSSGIWKGVFGDKRIPEGYEIHGIDVSHHQGVIDWQRLRDEGRINGAPVKFCIIKATEGSEHTDRRFSRNFDQARDHGIIRGAYHFWGTKTSAASQAEHFIRTVDLQEGDLPPVLDIEKKDPQKTVSQMQADILKWLSIVAKHYDATPIIYTNLKFREKYLDSPELNAYPYWIAHYYVDSLKYDGRWKFWQHTDVGRLPGIKGYVDFNVYNGSYYDLEQLTIK